MIKTITSVTDLDFFEQVKSAALMGGVMSSGYVPRIGSGIPLMVDVDIPDGAAMPEEKAFVKNCEVNLVSHNKIEFIQKLIGLLADGARLHPNSIPNFKKSSGGFLCSLITCKEVENTPATQVDSVSMYKRTLPKDNKEEAESIALAEKEFAKGKKLDLNLTDAEIKSMKLLPLKTLLESWNEPSSYKSKKDAAAAVKVLRDSKKDEASE